MSKRSGRGPSHRRSREADKQPPPSPNEASGGTAPGGADAAAPRKPVPLKGIKSLERLRDRVDTAAREIERLRAENEALADRLRLLEMRPTLDATGTTLAFDEDPDALREKVSAFIEAIDRYLEQQDS